MSLAAETLVDRAVRHVQAHIREHDLKVGDTLPGEGTFASQLGVSRAVMREAFGALAALRLLDVGNGRRARVGAIDGSVMGTSISHAVATAQVSTAQVWDVRRTLELRTVELAALNRTEEEAREIERLADEMAVSFDDPDRLVRTDIALHQAIAVASRNPLYQQIIRSFEPLMKEAVPAAWATRRTEEQRVSILDVHIGLARAITEGDGAKARNLVDAHFDASIADLFSET
ncbi:FadR/GntR family transcriptional regulator [Sphingomonas sp.]|jgi:DNA-binding FadR family transcriptional regulator|uniref:FadR/GntR family transcriptional regulator n=1 Tax=Sphingomonas sp. TaxID=28214 RepID=UPI002DEE9692|nr:FCD domain-containing protein [Sphingomonas sp.]